MKKKHPKKRFYVWMAGLVGLFLYALYAFNILPHPYYFNADFGIAPCYSTADQDQDGVDDQTDLLQSAQAYLEKKPKYRSQYYSGGYPDDEYGVCTDVVGAAFLGAGYDLRELVNADILAHREDYAIETVDKDIDFRRVRNLNVYFARHAVSLTTDLTDIAAWQGGDIVIFPEHIGILSDKRNRRGIPFLLHHAYPMQRHYEEDVLERYDILAHYRVP